MLFDTVITIGTSTNMTHHISTGTLRFLLLLLFFMIKNAPSNLTTIIIEIGMVNAVIPSILMNTGINRYRIVVTTITITVVVSITTTNDCD